MVVKKVPIRRCVGCGEGKPKKELVRIVRTAEGEISFDATGRKAGRGAYLCRRPECLAAARKKKSLERAFGAAIPDEVYARLAAEILEVADDGG
ncbi:MAG: RNase P modulator RnpM [Oscillospiraceae bacterium]